MDNAYQQKLQERADAIFKTYSPEDYEKLSPEDRALIIKGFISVAALTLKWSEGDYVDGHIDGYTDAINSTRPYAKATLLTLRQRLEQNGFIPPKTDNNE